MFFFEKKSQKTFISCRVFILSRATAVQKFFASFFQKRRPCFLLLLCAFAPCGTAVIPNMIGQDPPEPVTSLNPLIIQSAANQQLALLLFRPLVWIGQDDTMDTARSLAASVESLDGNTRIRVVLKPWRWSDGVPITSDDVLFTWQLIEQLGPLFAYVGQGGIPDRVSELRVIDAHTVEFQLARPVNPDWFTLNGLSNVPPLPRHAWGNMDKTAMWRRSTDPSLTRVVDGPFLLTEYELDRYAALRPNPLYGGAPARLARLVIAFSEGGDPVAILRSDEWDMAQIPTALLGADSKLAGFTAIRLPESFSYLMAIFNFHNDRVDFFRDVRVRQALADATDQATMIKMVYNGYSHEIRIPVPVLPPTWLSPAVRSRSIPVHYDPDMARAELEAAGWRRGPDGIRVRDGKRLEFSIIASADQAERLMLLQLWKSQLRAVGVDIAIKLEDFPVLNAEIGCQCDSWDAALLANTVPGVPDGSGNFDTNGTSAGGYSNPEMDKLIAESDEASGPQALFAYEDYLAREQPVITLPQAGFLIQAANRLGGVERFVNPQGFWAPEELWVRDEGCGKAADRAGH
jgi:peptide/nickel transport system substrate-binding protein